MTLQQCHQVETKIGVPCVSMHNATHWAQTPDLKRLLLILMPGFNYLKKAQ